MLVRSSRDIGLAVRESRRAKGWTQAELARRVGVGRQWLVELEHGKPRAELDLVLLALRQLDISLDLGTNPSSKEAQPVSKSAYDDLNIGEPDDLLAQSAAGFRITR